ncbi:MAG: PLP-dependent aminotransferase family protein [Proteobacteria bacterium]|nr:PLP-dependent aminotransferase family protein [Pseudomonadota bacterium]
MKLSKEPFHYERLVEELELKIANGTYKIGEKLPSIRDFHEQQNLSISTVYKAYVELEMMGLVEARPKSGYYVSGFTKTLKEPTFSLKKSPPRKVDLAAIIHTVHQAISDPRMLPLGGLVIAPERLPYKQFARILKGISADLMKSLLVYELPEGNIELRRQVAMRTPGIEGGVDPDDIIMTNGCMEALALSLQAVVRPGDTVIIERPTFFVVLQLLEEMGIYVIEIPTDPTTGMDMAALKKIIETNTVKACITQPNFQNPLGALMPDATKRDMVEFLNSKDIVIIEDNIYSELYFGESKPVSLKRFDRKDLVITCSSFSKTLAPGLRIGWVIPGQRFKDRIQRLKTGFSVSTSSLDQYVLAEFLSGGGYDRHLRVLRSQVRKQVRATAQAVQNFFPEKTRLMIPQGGAFLWVQLPDGIDSVALYWKALEHKIAILPGTVCSASHMFGNHVRLSCGYPVTNTILEGIRTLGNLVRGMDKENTLSHRKKSL